jgi:hypothetical protein
MKFIVLALEKGSMIVPTQVIKQVKPKGSGILECNVWLEGDQDPLIVKHSFSAMEKKLDAS